MFRSMTSRWSILSFPLALAACGSESSEVSAGGAGGDAVHVEMFVMSQCPYGVEVEQAITPIAKKLGSQLDVDIEFIGQGAAGSLSSMHGPAEVTGDLAQVCAKELAKDRLLDFVACQNETVRQVDSNWRQCAEANGIPVEGLEACINGDQGQQLLGASFATAVERGATGSPTIFVNGKKYEGGRKGKDFLKAACAELGEAGPQACKEIPPPVVVKAIFLSDARCPECDMKKLEPRLKSEFEGLEVEYVDYASERGKALHGELVAGNPAAGMLPAALFLPGVEQDEEGMQAVKRFLRPVGQYQLLALGGKWDPTAEICDNATDDDADGAADCADSGCAEQLVCRTEIPKKLDLYVMSQCPYGAKAMIATEQLATAFGDELDLDVHFIGSNNNGTLESMHGPAEVAEDLREICAVEKYPQGNQFMRYLGCRSKDYKSAEWEGCATTSGMDPNVIRTCSEGSEGQALLAASFARSQEIGFGASPTFLANNNREFNAIAVGPLQQEYCKDNGTLKGCANVLADATTDAAAAAAPAAECK
jgi:hypothetical protein